MAAKVASPAMAATPCHSANVAFTRSAGCTSPPTKIGHDDLGGAVSFAHVWATKILPFLSDEYKGLLADYPSRLHAGLIEKKR